MTEASRFKSIHRLFEVGVVLKGLNAALELLFGFLLLFVNVGAILQTLVANELIEDPTDFLANHLSGVASHFSPQAQFFSALYLLSHGLIKTVLVYGLLRDRLWAYPASLAVLGLFVVYQLITFAHSHSIALLSLTVFDLALIWLIWQEYQHHKRISKVQ